MIVKVIRRTYGVFDLEEGPVFSDLTGPVPVGTFMRSRRDAIVFGVWFRVLWVLLLRLILSVQFVIRRPSFV